MLAGFTEYAQDSIACVYLLYHFEKLVYIGSTVNLRNRLGDHRRTKRDDFVYNRVYYKVFATLEEAREVESELIFKLNPSVNLIGKPISVNGNFKPINLAALGICVPADYVPPIRRI